MFARRVIASAKAISLRFSVKPLSSSAQIISQRCTEASQRCTESLRQNLFGRIGSTVTCVKAI